LEKPAALHRVFPAGDDRRVAVCARGRAVEELHQMRSLTKFGKQLEKHLEDTGAA
jgi:hypothetical protein